MTITVKHIKVSTIPDDADTSLVRPSDWNDDHAITGTVPIVNGGTGQATANDGFNALAPSQTGNTGKYLTTNGTDSSWAANPLGTVTSVAATVPSVLSISGSPITTSGTLAITYSGTALPVANGGTSATTLTGYVKGNGTSAMTASATIPNTDITGLGTASTKDAGAALGVATLDSGGKVPVSELPAAVLGALSYQGTWNASTNTPTLTSSVGTKGYYYVVSVAGSTNLNGITDWLVGDWAVFNGSVWEKIDNTDSVTSVNGFTGAVVLTTTDVAEGTNLYYTDTRARNSISAGTGISYVSGTGVITNSLPDQTVVLTAGTGISTSGTYPNFTITNTSPSSGGTVTSVTGTSPVVSSGGNTPAISLASAYGDTQNPYASKTANYILAAPDGLAGVPTFRAIVAADVPTLNQNTTGSAATLTTGRTISVTGDLAYTSGSFNGSANVTGTGTLATVNTNVGSFTNASVTVNGKGLITAASSGTAPVTSVTGTSPVVSSGGATPAISMPAATTSVNGYLTSTDWTTFNNKGSGTVTSVSGTAGRITSTGGATPVIDLASGVATAGTTGSASLIPVVTIDTYGRVTSITTAANPQGTVTSVTGTSPVVSSGGATPAISMPAATTSVSGYLTSTDWTTFNGKGSGTVTSVAALTLGTTGTDLSSTVANGTTTPVITLQVPTASAANRGALSAADWTTFNGKAAAFTYTTGYIPYGQGTTTPNQSSSLTFATSTLTAPIVSASNGLMVNSNTVSASYSIPSGSSAMSVGPMTVSSGQSVTVPSGGRWVVL